MARGVHLDKELVENPGIVPIMALITVPPAVGRVNVVNVVEAVMCRHRIEKTGAVESID
jgi:hypothetical protein